MKRRHILRSLGVLLAAKLRGQTTASSTQGIEMLVGRTVTARVAQHLQANASYTIYTVGEVAGFLAMTLPLGQQVLWGGTILLPGVQYDASATGINLRNLPLNVGDTITIVSFVTTGIVL